MNARSCLRRDAGERSPTCTAARDARESLPRVAACVIEGNGRPRVAFASGRLRTPRCERHAPAHELERQQPAEPLPPDDYYGTASPGESAPVRRIESWQFDPSSAGS